MHFVKISGFSFIRNGIDLGYPFVPSLRSLLPLCDEIVVNVPTSTDSTLDAVKSIGDPRIRIIESEWDPTVGKPNMRNHTNLPLDQCTGDWCVYIQGDEVLHEDSISAMRATMERELPNPAVQGLLVDFTHFYGSFQTVVYSFGWYYQEIRVVRRDPDIRSWATAQGFRTRAGEKLRVKSSGGKYFHYGWALDPERQRRKVANLSAVHRNEAAVMAVNNRPPAFYDDDQKVKTFQGAHPAVMCDTVAAANWTYTSSNPLIRFRKNYFWEDIALMLYRCTGVKLGVRKNYRFIR